MTAENATTLEGLFMAFGRVEEGQKHVKESVDGLRTDLSGVVKTQGEQGILLALVQAQSAQNTLDIIGIKADSKPVKTPWTAIGAFCISGLALGWIVVKQIFIGS